MPEVNQDSENEVVKIADAVDKVKDLNVSQLSDMLVMGQEWALTSGLGWVVSIFSAVLVFYMGRWLAGKLSALLARTLEGRDVDPSLISFAGSLTNAGLTAFVVIAALGQLGVQTTSFVAIIGAAGLAIGLALQGSLSNFAAGVLMIIFRPIKLGDYVDVAGVSGSVKEIQIFATTLLTPDHKMVIVPNSSIMGGNIVNYSAQPTRRLDFEFGVAYDADLKQCREIFQAILDAEPRILSEPTPLVAVKELADSAVIFAVRPWVDSGDYWGVYFDITEKVKVELDRASVGIPFPQMDVHLRKVSD